MEPTIISYSPNDFIWNTVTPDVCLTDSACSANKAYSETILSAPSAHSGAKERYIDTKHNYNMQLLTSVNLGVGIIGIGVFIFYNH